MSNAPATTTVRNLTANAGPFTVTEAGFGSTVSASFFDRHDGNQHATIEIHGVASVKQQTSMKLSSGVVATGLLVTLDDGRQVRINFYQDSK